ncbi:MAG: zf-TFIIB domain-containing protein [Actinomycetes bacterium]
MDLTCPKCQGAMRSYERSGVTVDQCTECRGIFLDRGELERLVDADTRFHSGDSGEAPAPPPQQPQQYQQQQQYRQQQPEYQQQQYGGHGGQGYGHKPHKRRKSFFEDLFE